MRLTIGLQYCNFNFTLNSTFNEILKFIPHFVKFLLNLFINAKVYFRGITSRASFFFNKKDFIVTTNSIFQRELSFGLCSQFSISS